MLNPIECYLTLKNFRRRIWSNRYPNFSITDSCVRKTEADAQSCALFVIIVVLEELSYIGGICYRTIFIIKDINFP